MLRFLYHLIITPIEIVVEITFGIMYSLLNNYGLAIIAVSLVIQTLVLPLYKRSDAIQDEERARQKAMSRWVEHIKRTFKGDERYMMLSTYYRQQGYKSWYALGSSFSILLQIPFFIAAFHYLSNLTELSGQSFSFIHDLGRPDETFWIGALPINVLPIAMTLINMLSGAIYTRTLPLREKVQVYGLALVFLVLLYNSPAGLVLYWTINNLYSLCKNIVMKGIGSVVKKDAGKTREKKPAGKRNVPEVSGLFWASGIFLTLYMGFVVPSHVVAASATEFVSTDYGPMELLLLNVAITAGFFLVWCGIFYHLMNKTLRFVFTGVLACACVMGAVDSLFFATKMGMLDQLFVFRDGIRTTRTEKLTNLGVLLLIFAVLAVLYVKKNRIMENLVRILCVTAAVMCIANGFSISKQIRTYNEQRKWCARPGEKILHLSKTGNNVVVFMLDRAIGGYIPFLFDEKPELLEDFSGFTWYEDTLSYGRTTNIASPALYGGYEYTPDAMNARGDVLLKDKHNEAMLLMPTLFSKAGYRVTVCDAPYAGSYEWVPDYSMYYELDNTDAYMTEGIYTAESFAQFAPTYRETQQHAMFYYSVLKMLPLGMQLDWYRESFYFCRNYSYISQIFMKCYTTMTHLSEMTEITEDGDHFLLLQNGLTHDVAPLQKPEYVPKEGLSTPYLSIVPEERFTRNAEVDGHVMAAYNQLQEAHYDSNMAALMTLAKWFRFLQENDCWDNTRIILVADHGEKMDDLPAMMFENGMETESFNPLLMMKDFGAEGFTVNSEFMTNADTPALALSGLVENPVNPFTGKALDRSEKNGPQRVVRSEHFETTGDVGTQFDTSDGTWYEVTPGSIFDEKNWKFAEE